MTKQNYLNDMQGRDGPRILRVGDDPHGNEVCGTKIWFYQILQNNAWKISVYKGTARSTPDYRHPS